MKPMKIMLGAVALSAIVAGNANAGVSKETCAKSDKTIWVENVQNADGTKGACVPKNACKVNAFKDKFCNTAFADIQVAGVEYAKKLVNGYAATQLGWSDGCSSFVDVSVDNMVGQDYIGCYSNGNYMVFEFDDTHEHLIATGELDFQKAVCIIAGGTAYEYGNEVSKRIICRGISREMCEKIDTVDSYYDAVEMYCYLVNTPYKDIPGLNIR